MPSMPCGPEQRAIPGSLYPVFTQSESQRRWQLQNKGLAPIALNIEERKKTLSKCAAAVHPTTSRWLYIHIENKPRDRDHPNKFFQNKTSFSLTLHNSLCHHLEQSHYRRETKVVFKHLCCSCESMAPCPPAGCTNTEINAVPLHWNTQAHLSGRAKS